MRFLVQEQPYEKRLAAGLLRYALDGEPVGTTEEWRLTQAPDGYTVLRVDLDSRSAESGNSYLYHLVSDADGAPQRLTYRFYGSNGTVVKGNVLFDTEGITNSREVNGTRFEDELSGAGVFFFPSSMGLAFLARNPQLETAWTLNMYDEENLEALFGLVAIRPKITVGEDEVVEIGRNQRNARRVTITWADQTRHIWLSADNWTLQMQRDDGLTALETRFIRN
jgi:hypothetical protein